MAQGQRLLENRKGGEAMAEPNMAILQPSRKKVAPGDVFVIHYPAVGFLHGMVIFTDLPTGPMGPGSILAYVYDHRAESAGAIEDQKITRDNLLIPPFFINRLPWSRGYFQTVASRTIKQDDVLKVHCFKRLGRSGYVDLDGKPMDLPTEPCGTWGLDSYRTVDDLISKQLGIPLAPD